MREERRAKNNNCLNERASCSEIIVGRTNNAEIKRIPTARIAITVVIAVIMIKIVSSKFTLMLSSFANSGLKVMNCNFL